MYDEERHGEHGGLIRNPPGWFSILLIAALNEPARCSVAALK